MLDKTCLKCGLCGGSEQLGGEGTAFSAAYFSLALLAGIHGVNALQMHT